MRTRWTTLSAVILWLLLSSGSGADFLKGQEAYNNGDYETALAVWQPLAEGGDAGGQFGLGLLYANGFGVPLDDDQALKWYGLAAAQDHGEAQCNLAIMHANGWGVPQSDAEAFKWYSLAANNGVTIAQVNLGTMYFDGYGVDQDYVEAYKWFSIATELGNPDAGFKRDQLGERMSAEEIAAAGENANKWLDAHKTAQVDP